MDGVGRIDITLARDGDDTLLVTSTSAVGSSISFTGSTGQDLLLFSGTSDGLMFDGGNDDDQVVFAGVVTTSILRGGSGDGLYRFAGTPTGCVTVEEDYAGSGDASGDTFDFSSFTTGAITLDLALTTPQPQPARRVPRTLRICSAEPALIRCPAERAL